METLWEKVQFWKPKRKKLNYKLQNSPSDDGTWIEITSGKYSSVVYSYGKVKFSDEFDIPKLSFDYNIINSGQHDINVLQNDQEFVIIMGDILTEIIIQNESIRENNTENVDLQ